MKIIKVQKLSNNKYKIILNEDEFVTFDNIILDNNLLYKKDITFKEIENLKKETNYYTIYNKVLKFSSNKIRCKSEILNYLSRYDISEVQKKSIVEKLEKLRLIDDRKYCQAFINDKIYLSKYGLKRIEKLLKEKKIDDTIIRDELENVDYEKIDSNLENKIRKEISINRKYSNYEIRMKILNKLLNEGYSKERIIKLIDKYQISDEDILDKEFEKLYIKYIKKYDKKNFEMNIKQKLLKRGFDIDSINILIEKKQKSS